ncbi:MAG: NAD(P)-dependent oxidoreductase [Phycisphaerales bacterium]|nr:NAD(P)-dependent oxidoreductase [Phycisphaerales bacterium]
MNATRRNLGFIGLGIMGAPMAGHLLAAGHRLEVHTRTKSKAVALLDQGATWCGTPADVAAGAEVVFTMVTDTPDVEQVLFGGGGIVTAARSGLIIVDTSTISPQATRDFSARLAQHGVALLDAPVTGGDIGARNATLTIMVGGDTAAFEQARPVLELMGKKIVHVGASGAGQMLKACNQILCALNILGVSEALALAESSGIALETVIDVLGGGAGGSWALANYGPRIARGDYAPGFMIRLQQKDLRIVQEAAQAAAIALPGTALAQQLFRAVESLTGGGDLGTQAMMKAVRQLSNRPPPANDAPRGA